MKATSKILTLMAAAYGLQAWAIDGVTTATYSLNINQEDNAASELLGGDALPNATQWTETFANFTTIRDSETNKAATLASKNCPWNDTDLSAVGSSVLIVAKLSNTANGIIFTFGGTAANSYALIQRSASKIALVKNNSNTDNILEADIENGSTKFHSIVLTSETVEESKVKYTLYVDGESKATTVKDASLFAAGYQFGTTPQGSNPDGVTTGAGIQVDEFGAWTNHVLTADEVTAIAGAYPVWPNECHEITGTETYNEVKDHAAITVAETGILDIGNAFDANRDGLINFLGRVTGTGTIRIGGTINAKLAVDALKNTGCTIKFVGFTCWIEAGATIPFNMILEDVEGETPVKGLTISGANSGATYTFTGKISGSGSICYSQTDARTATFKVTGDVADWTGGFESANAGETVVAVPESFDATHVILPEAGVLCTKTADGLKFYKKRNAGNIFWTEGTYWGSNTSSGDSKVVFKTAKTDGFTTSYVQGDSITICGSNRELWLGDYATNKTYTIDGVVVTVENEGINDNKTGLNPGGTGNTFDGNTITLINAAAVNFKNRWGNGDTIINTTIDVAEGCSIGIDTTGNNSRKVRVVGTVVFTGAGTIALTEGVELATDATFKVPEGTEVTVSAVDAEHYQVASATAGGVTTYTVEEKTAPTLPDFIPEGNTEAATKYTAWATDQSVTDPADAKLEAFLLNCANTDEAIAEAKAAFKITSITVEGDTVTIVGPQGTFNGTVTIQGNTILTNEGWHEKADGDKFFKAVLDL